MSRRSNLALMLASASIGAAIGASAVLSTHNHEPHGEPGKESEVAHDLRTPRPTVVQRSLSNPSPERELERRVAALEGALVQWQDTLQRQVTAALQRAPVADAGASHDEAAIDGAHFESSDLFEQPADAHWSEPEDPRWSAQAEQSFAVDLADIQLSMERGNSPAFEVRELSCRSVSCLATLEWSSPEDALGAVETVAMHAYELDCSIGVLPVEGETGDGADSYLQEVMLDCGA